ncbi:flippase [Patescibacteria group bacterium]|nr:flippase [Patescibacteria group bacterium]
MPNTHNPKKVVRSSAIYTLALIYQKILSFTYFSIVARALGPEKLGMYIFALSFAAFFSLVVDFGFVPMAIRTFSQDDEKKQKCHFQTFFTIRLGLAALAIIILHAIAFALGYDSELRTLLAITSVIMIMDAFTAFFYAVFRSRQNLVYESIGTVIFQTIVFSTGLITIARTNDLRLLLMVIFTGSLFHIIFSSILIAKKAKISFKLYFDKIVVKQWMVRALPFFMAAGFIKAYNTIDTILIKNIAGDEAVGLFAIPAKIVFTFPFIALAITAAVYPAMSNYAKRARNRLQSVFTRTFLILLTISLPIAVGINLLAEPIITRVWPEFSASIPGLQILIWAVVFLYIEYPFGSLLNATGNERRNTVNRGIQFITFVALNLILIPLYGFMGAIYVAIFCSVLIVVLGYIRARGIVRVFDKKTAITAIKLMISSTVMGISVYWLRDEYSFLLIIPVAGFVYFIMLLLLRVWKKADLEWLRSVISNG